MKDERISLDDIVANKQHELTQLKKRRPLAVLKKSLTKRKTEVRDFSAGITKAGRCSLIAEIKQASPSEGIIRKHFNPVVISKTYEQSGFVDAISVLTESRYFLGDLSYIATVKQESNVPILRKDFIFDQYQIYESYLAEADAVLLIVSLLSQDQLCDLLKVCTELGMYALVEVHSVDEIDRGIKAGAQIIGINCRDLGTFTVETKLFSKFAATVPDNVLLVAESGITSAKDIASARENGADAVLIGTVLMKSDNIREKLSELHSRSINRLLVFGATELSTVTFIGQSYGQPDIGGNGVLASIAASRHVPVDLVSGIGNDLGVAKLGQSVGDKVSVANVAEIPGQTFRWSGTYDPVSFELCDELIDFGVYKDYKPLLNKNLSGNTTHVLLSGSNPANGLRVLEQLKHPAVIATDMLHYHLRHNLKDSLKLISKADYLFLNQQEYDYVLTKIEGDLLTNFPKLQFVFRKQGSAGVTVLSRHDIQQFVPPQKITPLSPANAGDVFAGTVMGMVANSMSLEEDLKTIVNAAQIESAKVLLNNSFYRKQYERKRND